MRNYLTKSNAVFCKRQVISYSVITWNYTFDLFYTLKVIDAESPIVIFSGTLRIYTISTKDNFQG